MPKYEHSCPKHFEIDCYTGCPFACRYCVEQDHQEPVSHINPNVEEMIGRMAELNPDGLPLYLSPKTDAYQPLEEKTGLSRKIIEGFIAADIPFFVISKSLLVERDVDLFRNREAFIAISLNTCDDDFASRSEPFAPPPGERMALLRRLLRISDLRTVVKIDPILPGLTDGSRLEELLDWLAYLHPFAVTVETARLNKRILAALEKGLTAKEYTTLATFYPDPGTIPKHPSLEYRLPLFRHINTRLDKAGIATSFCRATLSEAITDYDCRGGFR